MRCLPMRRYLVRADVETAMIILTFVITTVRTVKRRGFCFWALDVKHLAHCLPSLEFSRPSSSVR